MNRAASAPRVPGHQGSRRASLAVWIKLWCLSWVCWYGSWVTAQSIDRPEKGVEVQSLSVNRSAEGITVDYQLRVNLSRAVEEAAQRGVPLYFRADVNIYKPRWYWRDDRVVRASREWRLSYQPLTSTWRVSQAGLGQSHATLTEALATITQASQWRVAETPAAEADGRHYVEFSWRLDTSQLPRPLQIGLNNPVAGGADWSLGVERSVKLTAR
jgi:hypothetical protein